MVLSEDQKREIYNLILSKVRDKLKKYKEKEAYKPFHAKLFRPERIATRSFMQSFDTLLGKSLFEKIGEIVARSKFKNPELGREIKGEISQKTQSTITNIISGLDRDTRSPNYSRETREISKTFNSGNEERQVVDLYLPNRKKDVSLEIKSPKPNKNEMKAAKRDLLEIFSIKKGKTKTYLGLPYNPHGEGEEYRRWTVRRFFDLDNEVLIGKSFWDFLGGSGTYEELIEIFEAAGKELRKEIESKIKEIAGEVE